MPKSTSAVSCAPLVGNLDEGTRGGTWRTSPPSGRSTISCRGCCEARGPGDGVRGSRFGGLGDHRDSSGASNSSSRNLRTSAGETKLTLREPEVSSSWDSSKRQDGASCCLNDSPCRTPEPP